MTLNFISFASGSAGNCCLLRYIPDSNEGRPFGLIIDTGISLKRLKQGLTTVGLTPDAIDAILLTHDHLDHIRHLGSWCKRLRKPAYAPADLHKALAANFITKDHIGPFRKVMNEEGATQIGPFSVSHFTVPHDATKTIGYAISAEGSSAPIDYIHITDCGQITKEAIEYASKASTVTIESNYDEDMLLGGKYPEILKNRIKGGCGHLSNADCAEALRAIVHPGLKHIFLCHLSQNNNTPQLAIKAASTVIDPQIISLRALPRLTPTPLLTL